MKPSKSECFYHGPEMKFLIQSGKFISIKPSIRDFHLVVLLSLHTKGKELQVNIYKHLLVREQEYLWLESPSESDFQTRYRKLIFGFFSILFLILCACIGVRASFWCTPLVSLDSEDIFGLLHLAENSQIDLYRCVWNHHKIRGKSMVFVILCWKNHLMELKGYTTSLNSTYNLKK